MGQLLSSKTFPPVQTEIQSLVRNTWGYLCTASLISKCTHTKNSLTLFFILHFDSLCVGVTTFSECLALLPLLVHCHWHSLSHKWCWFQTGWYWYLCHIWWHRVSCGLTCGWMWWCQESRMNCSKVSCGFYANVFFFFFFFWAVWAILALVYVMSLLASKTVLKNLPG